MRDWVTKDFGWKLFSLFLAVAIWLTVHKIYEEPGAASGLAGGTPVTFGNLPVLVVSAASDVRDFRVAPATVTVKVTAGRLAPADHRSERLQVNMARVQLQPVPPIAVAVSPEGRVSVKVTVPLVGWLPMLAAVRE